MFALLSMILLEFACQVCATDGTKKKLANLTDALRKIDERYFTPLPGRCPKTSGFALPGDTPETELLGMIFDLVRNGNAHQYQSPIMTLSDGQVDIDLAGPAPGRELTRVNRSRPAKHLRYKITRSGDLCLYVRPDQLFLDIKMAIENSHIISPGDIVSPVTRPNKKTVYDFSVADLRRCLAASGHKKGRW